MASDAHKSLQPLHRLPIIGLLLLTALLLGGCQFFGGGEEQPTEPTPLDHLPPEWTKIEVKESSGPFSFFSKPMFWQSVNIDDDADPEFLLLYTYDNSAKDALDGPVGGVIFGNEATSAFATGRPPLPLPMQSTGSETPYRLLPSYVDGQQGAFLAPPSGDAENSTPVLFFQIQRTDVLQQEGASNGQEASPIDNENASNNNNDELVLTDGKTVLTFAWWRNEFDGYGVTQVRGPAGFREINKKEATKDGLTMSQWLDAPQEITSLDALYPLYIMLDETPRPREVDYADPGRSNLCRTFRYKRVIPAEQPSGIGGQVYRSDIQFNATNRGIQFCDQTPMHPFYPEGVVVKYLRATSDKDRQALLWAGLSEQDQRSILRKTHFTPENERIERIETRTNIDYPEDYRTARSPFLVDTRHLMTQVCVEVQPIEGKGGSRLLYFSLLHSRPNIEATESMTATTTDDGEHASDRLWIAYMDDASDWGATNCVELVAMDNE